MSRILLLLIVQASVLTLSNAKTNLDTLTGPWGMLKHIENLKNDVTKIQQNQYIMMKQIEELQTATQKSKKEQNITKVKGQQKQPFFFTTSKSKSIPISRHEASLARSSQKSKGETKRDKSIKVSATVSAGLTKTPLMQKLSEKQKQFASASRPQSEVDEIASDRMQQKPPTHSKSKPIINKYSRKHEDFNISRAGPAMPEGRAETEHTESSRARLSERSTLVFGNTSVAGIKTEGPLMQKLSKKQAKSAAEIRPQSEEDDKIASDRMQQKPPTHSKSKPIINKYSRKHEDFNISRAGPAMPDGRAETEHTESSRAMPSEKSTLVFGNTSVAGIKTEGPLMQKLSEKQAKSAAEIRPQSKEDDKIASDRMQQKPPTHSKSKPIINKYSRKHEDFNISRAGPAMPDGRAETEHTESLRARPSERSTLVFGNTSVAGIKNKEEPLYLVMSNKQKLVRVSLDGSMKPILINMPFAISSLAYDSTSHSLFWLSTWKKTAGQFDSHYTPDTLWHFPTSSIEFTIDRANRIMYLLNGRTLETVNLESKHLINETREIMATQLAVRIGMNGKLIANSRKRSVIVLRESAGRVIMYEVNKRSKRLRMERFNLKSAVYLQDGEKFLYCDGLNLMSFSPYTRQTTRIWLECPPNVLRLLHYKGTLCAITKESVYTAKFEEKDLSKPPQSQMTPLEVDRDLLSPIAELVDL